MSRTSRRLNIHGVSILCLALVIPLLVVGTSTAQDKPTITIGAVVSLTGRDAAFGRECLAGLTMAVAEANGQGGIKGAMIRIQSYDDRSDPIFAAEGVRVLAREYNPIAIVGSSTSMVTQAAAVAAQDVGIPLVVPEATNPAITSIGDWVYRVCFVDPDMAEALATFAYTDRKLRKVAIMQEERHDYTQSLARHFDRQFRALGGEIVLHVGYPAGRADFSDVIERIKLRKADAIFVSGFYPEAAAVMRAAKNAKLTVTFLGGDGWESPEFFAMSGDALDHDSRVFIASHFSADVTRSKVRGFVDAFTEQEGHAPITSSALGFDAGGAVVDALEMAPELTHAGLKAALSNVRHEGVTGQIVMDSTRNARKKVIIMQARPDQTFAFVSAVSGKLPDTKATTAGGGVQP